MAIQQDTFFIKHFPITISFIFMQITIINNNYYYNTFEYFEKYMKM